MGLKPIAGGGEAEIEIDNATTTIDLSESETFVVDNIKREFKIVEVDSYTTTISGEDTALIVDPDADSSDWVMDFNSHDVVNDPQVYREADFQQWEIEATSRGDISHWLHRVGDPITNDGVSSGTHSDTDEVSQDGDQYLSRESRVANMMVSADWDRGVSVTFSIKALNRVSEIQELSLSPKD